MANRETVRLSLVISLKETMSWFTKHDQNDEDPFNVCSDLAVVDESDENQFMVCGDMNEIIYNDDELEDGASLVSSLNHVGPVGTFDDSLDDTTLGSDYQPDEHDRDVSKLESSILSQNNDTANELGVDPENVLATTTRVANGTDNTSKAVNRGILSEGPVNERSIPMKAAFEKRPPAAPEKTVAKRRFRLVPLLCLGVLLCILAIVLIAIFLPRNSSSSSDGASKLQSSSTAQPTTEQRTAPTSPKAPQATHIHPSPQQPVHIQPTKGPVVAPHTAPVHISATIAPVALQTTPTASPATSNKAPTASPVVQTAAPTSAAVTPTAAPVAPSASPTSSATTLFERYVNLLLPHVHENIFLNGTTPQGKAFKILVAQDHSTTLVSDARFLQRFALLSVFFSTSPNKWKQRSGWSNFTASECDWYGIAACKVTTSGGDQLVSNIQLGKAFPCDCFKLSFLAI